MACERCRRARERLRALRDKLMLKRSDYSHLYKDRRWRWLRLERLSSEPLCRMCAIRNRVVAAEHVDHIKPHKGNEVLFYDYDNTQSLCGSCHNSAKQGIERRGYDKEIGKDGWPTDPNHPANRKK
jgi:5-methylcytosine-specific restriction protein A